MLLTTDYYLLSTIYYLLFRSVLMSHTVLRWADSHELLKCSGKIGMVFVADSNTNRFDTFLAHDKVLAGDRNFRS